MLGELLPIVLVPAAALALAIRTPGQVTHGKAPVGPQMQQWAVSMTLLVVACWLALAVGPGLAQTDVGGFAIAVIALPLTLAVAWALQPQLLDPAPPSAPKARPAAPAPADDAKKPSEVVTESGGGFAKESDIPTQVALPTSPQKPRELGGPEIEGTSSSEAAAIARIIDRLGDRPGLVFSPRAEAEANETLHRIAGHLRARRYMSLPPEKNAADDAHIEAARNAAGPNAAHASELALDLAGGAITSLLLLDDRIELSPLAIQGLERVESAVLCGRTENPVVASCKVRIPSDPSNSERAELLGKLADKLGVPAAGSPESLSAERSGATLAGLIAPAPSSVSPPVVLPPPASSNAPIVAPPVSPSASTTPKRKSTGLTGLFAAVGTPTPSAPAPMTLPSTPTPSPSRPGASSPGDANASGDGEDAASSQEEE